MHYEMTLRTGLDRDQLEARIRELSESGPFAVSRPEPTSGGHWRVALRPRRTDIAIGFAKVAEFQLLLARTAEVLVMRRTDSDELAVAS